ncbi:dihydrofolate reductase [Ihubacter massiliensis]|uniref:Dihydrofolate reductase n=1 Tax=Hominibacterium faecale TaxID=2839743 RepID=A0A9J6QXV3_9FIRM|nr:MULTISPECIES: dihydrofolate reductase [Eubacteriales Family XIII. Incertae Sedis]MCO7122070.1 dihydrofolate reductase [Ihubacter massiliensis]MCU7380272.1 dihydrofolate reductase [Hominibacterium faecale]
MNTIVVVDENWNIGRDGGLLVHLPGDLKYFKERTYGKTVVVGRKTLESFPGAKPLPGRKNVVLSRNEDYNPKDCTVYHSKEELMEALAGEEVFVSGGEQIYLQFMEDCRRFYVTKIYASFPADRSFPNLDEMEDLAVTWKSDVQEEKGIRYQFFEYTRI